MENSFRDCLIQLMPVLVGRGQLVVKEVNGARLTGKDLAQYFKVSRSAARVNLACTSAICNQLFLSVYVLHMAALRSRCGHCIFALWFLSSIFFLLLFLA